MTEQFLFRKDPIAMLNKIGQDAENLRLELNGLTSATKFIALDIEFPFFKRIEHKPPPCPDTTAKL
jgi:hypothetical protein